MSRIINGIRRTVGDSRVNGKKCHRITDNVGVANRTRQEQGAKSTVREMVQFQTMAGNVVVVGSSVVNVTARNAGKKP